MSKREFQGLSEDQQTKIELVVISFFSGELNKNQFLDKIIAILPKVRNINQKVENDLTDVFEKAGMDWVDLKSTVNLIRKRLLERNG